MEWEDFAAILADRSMPAAVVDLDALERNVDRLCGALRGTGKSLRVASKSVRHVGLLRRILERGAPAARGLMCFTLAEAAFLSEQGFDDLLVAYPSVQDAPLRRVAARVKQGASIRLIADAYDQLAAYGLAAVEAGCELEVVLDLDVSYEALLGKVHLGVQRSPLRSAEQVVALARQAHAIHGVRVVGLMGYEAHVAGLPDATPFSPALNPVRKALKRLSIPRVAELREASVRALEREGVALAVVNGGGTGSIASTAREPWVTEVTAGSGFVCSHLFDYYEGTTLEPAAFFALEVCRIPEHGIVTCLGGGYVASGEPGWDRLPVPWLPHGLSYLSMEGAGEVQTPLRLPKNAPPIAIGDPIVFRHAKAGELAERFDHYLLARGSHVEAIEPTYRGQGRCFL
ncbi:MAG: alanine racemase [Sandaracinaceae bacterium]|nr:alanine racemase [Sandaracinaceae bacterium]